MANKRQIGSYAEQIAANFLIQNGYRIVEMNFRCKTGEIDIIAEDEDYTVFVEVKYRKDISNGFPREAVNIHKQKTIIKTAKFYIFKNNLYNCNFRFDVVEMIGDMEDLSINLIKDAFQS